MEYFDVVNKKDEVIGKASRDECHTNPDLIHRTVQFTLVDKKKKKILLTQRSFNLLYDPGKMCFVGEHVQLDESYEKAIKRGVREELGFITDSFKEVENHIFTFSKQTEIVRFFVIEWNGEKINFDKEEIVKRLWLPVNKITNKQFNLSEMTKFWIKSINWNKVLN